jgi:anti-anti-sigma factor
VKAGENEGVKPMEPAFRTYGGFDAAGLRVVGELDLGCRDRLRSLLRDLAAREVERVWLDLEGVIFVDCGCLRELERFRQAVVASGRRFELTAASPLFVRVAELACFDELAALGRAVVRRPWRPDEDRGDHGGQLRDVAADTGHVDRLREPPG